MKLIVFGAGYCSRFLIPLLSNFKEIICTHKSNLKSELFDKKFKVKRLSFDEFFKKKKNLSGATHILNSIPPDDSGDLLIEKIIFNLDVIGKNLKWFGYFSSTSVYGDHKGKWVDEDSKLNPTTTRGFLRMLAEREHMNAFSKYGLPIHIFRLPGIYGPGRSIFERLQRKGFLCIKKNGHFFSRVHVEDIASAIAVSINKPSPGQIFNLADDVPCSSDKIVDYATELLKIPRIDKTSVNDKGISEMTRSFYKDNKKISNKKIKKILGWTPKFRNYKLGLKAIFNKNS